MLYTLLMLIKHVKWETLARLHTESVSVRDAVWRRARLHVALQTQAAAARAAAARAAALGRGKDEKSGRAGQQVDTYGRAEADSIHL